MAAALALPFHPSVGRYCWNDQFFMCPQGDDEESDNTFDELRAFIRDQRGRKVGLNVLLREGARPPTAERRARTREQMHALEANVAHSATVILGAGFFASLFLGISGTMMRMRATQTPRLLTQSLTEFAGFVSTHASIPVSPFEVLSTTNWILHDLQGRPQQSSALRAAG